MLEIVAAMVVAVVLQWLARFGVKAVVPDFAGFAVGTASGGALVEAVDWQACFVAASLAGVLGAAIVYAGRGTLSAVPVPAFE